MAEENKGFFKGLFDKIAGVIKDQLSPRRRNLPPRRRRLNRPLPSTTLQRPSPGHLLLRPGPSRLPRPGHLKNPNH
jgi:hypothetical protein